MVEQYLKPPPLNHLITGSHMPIPMHNSAKNKLFASQTASLFT